ncbi:MAG: ABC transporter substrate-binding protein [Proteobacteria bacterium]|nr:ABC transporter substrate-binding protein [Pseudomonadota bacterium]
MAWRGWRARGLAALLAGVGIAHADVSVQDDRGRTLRWPTAPQRIVSLAPALTESVCALGGCDRLVGVDRYSNAPASVRGLPRLGGLDDALIEAMVALHPDVVLAAPAARAVERLEALGIPVVALQSRNQADVQRDLAVLARLLDRPARAESLWAEIEAQIAAASARVPVDLRGQRIYFEVDTGPYAAGADSFIGEILARLHMRNALPAELGPFPKLNPEYVVRLQPDIVMASQAELAEMRTRPGWSALRALRDGRSCGFPTETYDALVRPGPRMGVAAGVIADCLAGLGAERHR